MPKYVELEGCFEDYVLHIAIFGKDMTFEEYLTQYPAADVAPVIHAHKIHAHSQGGGTHWVICSNCEKPIVWQDTYCKHCGAKMDKEV